MTDLSQLLELFAPANTAVYLVAGFIGLYVHFKAAQKNGRTQAETFSDYWLKETPGLSIATLVTLATAASVTIHSGALESMSGLDVFILGFGKAFVFDALIQSPATKA